MVNAHCSESPHAVMVSFLNLFFATGHRVMGIDYQCYGINERRMWDETTGAERVFWGDWRQRKLFKYLLASKTTHQQAPLCLMATLLSSVLKASFRTLGCRNVPKGDFGLPHHNDPFGSISSVINYRHQRKSRIFLHIAKKSYICKLFAIVPSTRCSPKIISKDY